MQRINGEGAPGKNCRSRRYKVVMRKPHWRQIEIIDERDERGNPTKSHFVDEPAMRVKSNNYGNGVAVA